MITRPLAKQLRRLNQQGTIPASALTDTQRRTLNALFDTEVLVEMRKGRGHAVVIANREAFAAYLKTHLPGGLDHIDSEMSRQEAVAILRDSKQGRLNSEVVLLSARPQCVLTRGNDRLDVGKLTQTAQVAAFVLHENEADDWRFVGRVLLVENYACFETWQTLAFSADMAVWTKGRLSERIIRWLASPAMQGCTFLHWGDYDPVGLSEYLRLKDRLSERVNLYIPEGIAALFETYANQALLAKENAYALLKHLRDSNDPDVQRIIGLIDRNNGGLEQEILIYCPDPT